MEIASIQKYTAVGIELKIDSTWHGGITWNVQYVGENWFVFSFRLNSLLPAEIAILHWQMQSENNIHPFSRIEENAEHTKMQYREYCFVPTIHLLVLSIKAKILTISAN